jgi:hypothetical protein
MPCIVRVRSHNHLPAEYRGLFRFRNEETLMIVCRQPSLHRRLFSFHGCDVFQGIVMIYASGLESCPSGQVAKWQVYR